MSDISRIVDFLNTRFTAVTGNFTGKAFQKGRFTGLCKQIDRVLEDETVEKMIILYDDVDGKEGTDIVIDDKYPFQLYHRVKKQKTSDEPNEEFFGDDDSNKIIIFEMGLIVISDKFNVELSQEQLITGLVLDFPVNIKPSQVASSQFSDCEIKLGDIESESSAVLEAEVGKKKGIPQQFILLDISYEIKVTYNKACYDLC